MENGQFHQNGNSKRSEDELELTKSKEKPGQMTTSRRNLRQNRSVARGMWFGVTTNEVIGYCVMLMFFFLGTMVFLGALVPQWATVEYRNVLMSVFFLYGIYRGVTTYAKASQWRRRNQHQANRAQFGLNEDDDENEP